jgi:hypothetical protein
MSQVMSMQEIRDRFAGEWVLIGYEELDEYLNVLRGEVLAHSVHRDEIYQRLLSLEGKRIAIEYLGEIPEDLAVVL